MIQRRELVIGGVAAAALLGGRANAEETPAMYGLIGSLKATAGKRDELIGLLLEGSADMPGCLSYVVAADAADAELIWITEVWTDEAAHDASLQLPQVRAAIGKARPLLAGFGMQAKTRVVGGAGLPKP